MTEDAVAEMEHERWSLPPATRMSPAAGCHWRTLATYLHQHMRTLRHEQGRWSLRDTTAASSWEKGAVMVCSAVVLGSLSEWFARVELGGEVLPSKALRVAMTASSHQLELGALSLPTLGNATYHLLTGERPTDPAAQAGRDVYSADMLRLLSGLVPPTCLQILDAVDPSRLRQQRVSGDALVVLHSTAMDLATDTLPDLAATVVRAQWFPTAHCCVAPSGQFVVSVAGVAPAWPHRPSESAEGCSAVGRVCGHDVALRVGSH